MTAPPSSGTGGGNGLYTVYSSTAAASVGVGTVLATLTVAPGWYETEVWAYNPSATSGVASQDTMNLALNSDPSTAATMVLQRIIHWNYLGLAVVAAPFGSIAPPTQTRVFAKSTITVTSFQAATTSTTYVVTLSAFAADVSSMI